MTALRVTLPGESYDWDPDELTVAEALMLENETGLAFSDWLDQIDDRRAVACQVLIWFLRRREGRQEDRMAVEFPIRKLKLQVVEGDPKASGQPSNSSDVSTPPPSPTSTESGPGNGSG